MSRGPFLVLARGAFEIQVEDIVFPPSLAYGVNESFVKVFICAYTKFLEDSPLSAECGDKPLRLIKTFFYRLVNNNIADEIKRYSRIADSLLNYEYTTSDDASTSIFVDDMRHTPVFKEYFLWRQTGRPELIKYVLSFLLFGKKLQYIDPEFNATALRGWREVEERLRTLKFDAKDVETLNNILSVALPRLNTDFLLPRFGPGKVSEPSIANVYDKLEQLKVDRRLRYVFHRPTSFRLDNGTCSDLAGSLEDGSINVSRLKFVPKDITKSRSICMEPNGYMFYQQEVHRWLQASIRTGSFGRFINLRKQSLNRDAAILGSKTLRIDTLDLSSASDSVHVELVRRIFPRDYLFYLLGTRTSKVLIPGEREPVTVNKFAPMGSACCFPVQCLIFTAVCVYASMSHSIGKTLDESHVFGPKEVASFIKSGFFRKPGQSSEASRRYEPPRVFGDDILCDTRITDHVVAILSRLGFHVNESKSFRGRQSFRESCGVYAWKGYDVTPTRFRLKSFKIRNDFRWDPSCFASLIEAINNFGDFGYRRCAGFLIQLAKSLSHERIKFTEDRNVFGIWVRHKQPVPDTALRYNANWQITEEKTLGIVPIRYKGFKPNKLDSYTMEQWWRSRISSEFILPLGRGLLIRPQETRIAPVWSRCE